MSELKNNMLSDNELENVSGGLLFYAGDIDGSDPNRPWEVLDNNNGNVIRAFGNRDDAIDFVRHNYGDDPLNTMEVSWGQVQNLRRR